MHAPSIPCGGRTIVLSTFDECRVWKKTMGKKASFGSCCSCRSEEVKDVFSAEFAREKQMLRAALEDFRAKSGFGRAVSAPQIGVMKRFIAVNLGAGTFFVINPVLTHRSAEMFSMYDDCMSFPWLMVRVLRHSSISVTYTKEDGSSCVWEMTDRAAAELLQHEIDHLDGVLALDLAITKQDIISRSVFEGNIKHFRSLVDYWIVPTL